MAKEIPKIRMELESRVPLIGYDGLLADVKPDKAEKSYTWSSGFLDRCPPAWMHLYLEISPNELFFNDIETRLTLVPKDKSQMPVGSITASKEPGYECGFTAIQRFGRENKQRFGLTEFENRGFPSLIIPYSDQMMLRDNMRALLNDSNFPFNQAIYEMLGKSYCDGKSSDTFEKYKRIAMKKLNRMPPV